MLRLTQDQADDLASEEGIDLDNGDTLELVEVSDWTQDYKYQHAEAIYQHSNGKFYSQHLSRCGSHWDGYELYPSEELYEVEKVEVTTYEWRVV